MEPTLTRRHGYVIDVLVRSTADGRWKATARYAFSDSDEDVPGTPHRVALAAGPADAARIAAQDLRDDPFDPSRIDGLYPSGEAFGANCSPRCAEVRGNQNCPGPDCAYRP